MQSRAAALAAVSVFNSPTIDFKSETFIILMNIAWTYLLHAHYRKNRVEYRYFEAKGRRRYYKRSANGGFRYWSLTDCLKYGGCPLDGPARKNLAFLIGLRDEITHHMSPALDHYVSARYQACLLNYNDYIRQLFGDGRGLDQQLSYSLQLQGISRKQLTSPMEADLPKNVRSYIAKFDSSLSAEDLNSNHFAYSMLFVPRLVGKRAQADEVIEFLKPESDLTVLTKSLMFKEVERPKFLPNQIVQLMRDRGYPRFSVHWHTGLWKSLNAKDPAHGWGVRIAGAWYWYENWIDLVQGHCIEHASRYT
ncbi:MAG: DUF3644 domain-containing protein [Candidatus Dormibacteria bacterium]